MEKHLHDTYLNTKLLYNISSSDLTTLTKQMLSVAAGRPFALLITVVTLPTDEVLESFSMHLVRMQCPIVVIRGSHRDVIENVIDMAFVMQNLEHSSPLPLLTISTEDDVKTSCEMLALMEQCPTNVIIAAVQ